MQHGTVTFSMKVKIVDIWHNECGNDGDRTSGMAANLRKLSYFYLFLYFSINAATFSNFTQHIKTRRCILMAVRLDKPVVELIENTPLLVSDKMA